MTLLLEMLLDIVKGRPMKYLYQLALLLLITGCAGSPEPQYEVQVRWTSHGIPHVKADDWGSLGYGFAYATAMDGVCVIARDVVRVRGELSKYFGPDDGNFESDAFHKALIDQARLDAFTQAQSARTLAFSDGYVAGYNRLLRDSGLPASCKDAPWVREMDADDLTRVTIGVGIRYGLGQFDQGIASNGVAIGSALSASGRGILLGNPHYPWHGPSRFHMIHLTIPGELDVMGASLLNSSRVAIGFNKDVAWTHTVSTALRFTLYELQLDPQDPTRYRYDDAYRQLEAKRVDVEVRGEEGIETRSHQVLLSHFGPVLQSGELGPREGRALAIRDAVIDNYLTAETYDAMALARSTEDIEAAISRQGIYWVNTIAADRHGNAFYADISATPNVDAALIEDCRVARDALPDHLVVLDGSRSACEWREDERSLVPGTLPPEAMPRITRPDYVTNTNDSFWLSNPQAPLEGYSPIIGPERTARSLRTRAGLVMMAEFIERGGQITPEDVQAMIDSHRNYSAELLLEEVLGVCRGEEALAEACAVLTAWGRTEIVDARGAHLWREIWILLRETPDLWKVPFDLADPVNTPRGLNIENDAVHGAVLAAIKGALVKLAEHDVAIDARLGDVQYAVRNQAKIAVPGGDGLGGMFSMIITELESAEGYTPIIHGNSYMQVISWDAEGKLDPRAILTYSQSPEPDSPYFADQTQMYAQGRWLQLPFSEVEIQSDPNLTALTLIE